MAKKSFAVIGMGRFGQSVVEELIKKDVDVLVIDKDPDVIAKMSKIATHAVTLDTTDAVALKEVGISSIDHVVVAIGEEIQSSILTTLILKDLAISAAVKGSIFPTLLIPSVRSMITLLFAFVSFSLSTAIASADPIPVPSSSIPICT